MQKYKIIFHCVTIIIRFAAQKKERPVFDLYQNRPFSVQKTLFFSLENKEEETRINN